jgi:hypothetical protein
MIAINTKKINVAIFLIIVTIMTGCISEKKMNRYVVNQYGTNISAKKIKSDYISITSPLLTDNTIPSESVKKTKKVLPFILYLRIYYQTSCTLNPKIPINQYSSALSPYANSKGLKQKLNGGKLELSIDKVPLTFSFNDDYQFLLFVSWERIYWLPQTQEMVVSYKVINNSGQEVKKGSISVPDPDNIRGKRYFQSVRSATGEYLQQYDENIKSMAKYTVDELMKEL